jgi:phosphoesterase RecJ-like protein
MWEEVAAFIKAHRSYLITTHLNPEGDAIGSEIALGEFLEDQGKTVYIVNSDSTPKNCRFLDPNLKIRMYDPMSLPGILSKVDGVIIVDVNSWQHIGEISAAIRESGKPRVCIDHHQGGSKDIADIYVRDTSAASAGVLISELIQHLKGRFTQLIVDALYTSLIVDTGTFRFSNTDARAFAVATMLVDNGADPFRLHRQVFANRTWNAGRLLGPVLSTFESAAGGKLVWIYVTRDMFDRTGAEYEDCDGFIEFVRGIQGVELSLFFKETEKGIIKLSLRSNGRVDAYEIAKEMGGGGHKMAAGVNLAGPMEKAIAEVVARCLQSPVFDSSNPL